ncbi:IreB family regulatory phosphoprotein [Halanaerobacter jeridensis]|uniref:Uncharacterized protein (UPF0297 family) n=1 Tax=Halanaerobacter jeridensis TaxID=706427 RepID=A0A938XRG9_9FIRM|nr:IreB family regulatory phosphoprotein [Halanaerobacter jeridensis]MBM7556053.1 uncharacterized protein (UPF0297 family) [Halanaerobacter jeridensis]
MSDKTMMFKLDKEEESEISEVLQEVYEALEDKGYNPIDQIVGYILSGDPTYITSHKDARSKIRQFEVDEMVEELVRSYLDK